MEWLFANWWTGFEAVSLVVAGASMLAKLTPTKKDDKILGKIQGVLDFFALNNERR